MKNFSLITFLLLLSPACFGQINSLYPDVYSSYFFNWAELNPAYIPENGSSESIIQSKVRSGLYSDISTISGSFQKTFQTKGNQWHSGRVLARNEKEGPYISTPRLYGNYGIRVQLKEQIDLMAGLTFGLVNPNFNTPTKSISTVLPDGALGVMLRYKKTLFGFSGNQVFNNTSKETESLNLNRYYNTQLQSAYSVSPFVDLKGYFLWNYYTDIPSQFNFAASALIQEKVETGLGLKTLRGIFFFASVTFDQRSQHPITINALYNSTLLDKSPALGGSMELNLSYSY